MARGTRRWFEHDEADALVAATTDPCDPGQVMRDFVAFVDGLRDRGVRRHPLPSTARGSTSTCAGSPSTSSRGIYERDGLFDDTLCLRSYAAAVTGRYVGDVSPATLPSEWLGDVPHTHRAIDDAVGYAHLLAELFKRAADAVGA